MRLSRDSGKEKSKTLGGGKGHTGKGLSFETDRGVGGVVGRFSKSAPTRLILLEERGRRRFKQKEETKKSEKRKPRDKKLLGYTVHTGRKGRVCL